MAVIEGSSGGSSKLLSCVDQQEQYGRHIIDHILTSLGKIETACDLGVGQGEDLEIVRKYFPSAKLFGIDFSNKNQNLLKEKHIELKTLDLEKEHLDFDNQSIDLFIANQVYEHLKEIFWVSHQISRCLKVGGYVLIGVPNICAFHNRMLFNFGFQPSQMKSYSAHIRGFGPREIPKFFHVCFPKGFTLVRFAGAQFYPFPKRIARILCKIFPSYAHTVFFLMQKCTAYTDEFIHYPIQASLETNFYTGP